MKNGNTLTHNTNEYTFLKKSNDILIWIGIDERSYIVTNDNNTVIFEIEAKSDIDTKIIGEGEE